MPPLDRLQHWMQSVITHPEGVAEGIRSQAAQSQIELTPEELERVIARSKNLTSQERLAVYRSAYFLRLVGCLEDVFPILRKTVGEETFAQFALGYLQHYPSQSYTLARLGERFVQYLAETRPPREAAGPAGMPAAEPDAGRAADAPAADPPDWADFLIDLARLEWTVVEVFDGPGVEQQPALSADELAKVPADRWPQAKLVPAACLRLVEARFPVNAFFTRVRAGDEEPEWPDPEPSYVAVNRRDYVVRRHDLSHGQFVLLWALCSGRPVGEAILAAAEVSTLSDEQLAAALHEWFRAWTAAQFFTAIA